MGAEPPEFVRRQLEFAAHIRDPETAARPEDVEDRRMAIYRELFFNNIENYLSTGFPVLRDVTPDDRWQAMARDFFARHRSHTPYFPRVAEEFLEYLQQERQDSGDPAFLLELAHYEYMEVVAANEDVDPGLSLDQRGGDLLEQCPLLSPLAWPLAYRFPVHRIGPDFQPATPPETPTFLVVYRNRDDDVGFLEINAVTHRLLQLLEQDAGLTGRQLLEGIAAEIGHDDPELVVRGGLDILKNLYFLSILTGIQTHS